MWPRIAKVARVLATKNAENAESDSKRPSLLHSYCHLTKRSFHIERLACYWWSFGLKPESEIQKIPDQLRLGYGYWWWSRPVLDGIRVRFHDKPWVFRDFRKKRARTTTLRSLRFCNGGPLLFNIFQRCFCDLQEVWEIRFATLKG